MTKLSEHEEQVAVKQWADAHIDQAPCLEWLHAVPNGAKLPWRKNRKGERYSPEAQKLKAEGLVPGILDLALDVARHDYHGLKIEMKAKGGEVREGQVEYMDFLATEGYLGQVCYGAIEAVGVLRWYLGIECDITCIACQLVEYE